MRYFVLLLIASVSTGCADYSGMFHPHSNVGIITAINKRKPFDEKPSVWPSQINDEEHARSLFMRRVQKNASYDGGFCMLELDGEIIDAAVYLASPKAERSEAVVQTLRVEARKKLLKSGTRSFLFVHNSSGVYSLYHPEPVLISQSEGKGRLVGMSIEAGLGLKAGEIGLVMFENKVGACDSSHAVRLNFTFASDTAGLGQRAGVLSGVPQTQKTFTFKGETSPLSMLKDAFAPHLPAPTKLPEVQTSGVTSQDALIIGEVALRMLRFLKKV